MSQISASHEGNQDSARLLPQSLDQESDWLKSDESPPVTASNISYFDDLSSLSDIAEFAGPVLDSNPAGGSGSLLPNTNKPVTVSSTTTTAPLDDTSNLDNPSLRLPYPTIQAVEGSSSRIPQPRTSLDLELQTVTTRQPTLTYQQRLDNFARLLFPFRQTYERLSNGIATGRLQANTPGRFIGLGTDGVFRNLAAKPDRELDILGREQHPPTYEEAAADSTPEYWEVGVVNPVFEDEVFVRGLPVGSFGNLLWNAVMTVAFKMVAFVLCYLLHTSHAAKEGTRIGFGAMLIMYGYQILPTNFGSPDRIPPRLQPAAANKLVYEQAHSFKINGKIDTYVLNISPFVRSADNFGGNHEPYLAYGVIAFGLFSIFLAFVNFYQVKQDERKMLAPPPQQEQHSNTESIYSVPE